MGNDLCFETLSLCKRSYCVRNSQKVGFSERVKFGGDEAVLREATIPVSFVEKDSIGS